MYFFILIFSLIFSSLHAKDLWEGDTYANNSESQKLSALDFMGKEEVGAFHSILDVGCGDGKITATMARAIPNGRVVGVDISPSMISFAKKSHHEDSNLKFFIQDAATLEFQDEFDLITSFTVMQWVLEQKQALLAFSKALKPEGRLWIQIPTGLPAAMKEALNETLSSPKWSGYFTSFSPPWRFYQAEEYRALLLETGFTPLRLETVHKHEQFPSRLVFQGFLRQWFPYLRPLPEELKDSFLTDLLDHYLTRLPPSPEGRVSFILDRIEVDAKLNTQP